MTRLFRLIHLDSLFICHHDKKCSISAPLLNIFPQKLIKAIIEGDWNFRFQFSFILPISANRKNFLGNNITNISRNLHFFNMLTNDMESTNKVELIFIFTISFGNINSICNTTTEVVK